MRKSFMVKINEPRPGTGGAEGNGVANVVGDTRSGAPYVWIGPEGAGEYRATIDTRSMDALCRAWIRLRVARKEWKV